MTIIEIIFKQHTKIIRQPYENQTENRRKKNADDDDDDDDDDDADPYRTL